MTSASVTRVKTQAAEPILSSDTHSSATDRPQNTPNSAIPENCPLEKIQARRRIHIDSDNTRSRVEERGKQDNVVWI